MSTELEHITEPHEQQPSSLPAKMEYARALAASSLLPKHYQRQPANVLLALELGEALGIPAIQAITGIHVIEGKPSASAELIGSLVRRAGHKLRIKVDHQRTAVLAQLIRADDPDHTFEARWDLDRAKQAGLTGKDNWRKDPIAMLTARAVTQVARQGAPDALYGVSHTPDEVTFTVPSVARLHQNRVTAAEILAQADDVIDAETGEVIDAETVEPDQQSDWPEVAQPADAR